MVSDHQGDATSRSHLFAPSASSTNRPSRSNLKSYGASDDNISQSDSVASFELLLPKGHQRSNIPKLRHYCRTRPVMTATTLIVCSGVVALMIALVLPSSHFERKHFFATKKHWLDGAERPPFSTLDPVHDLGLYSLSRPDGSSPPASILRDTKQRALPTNTWYQNLLMAKGEPNSVHRAYPMPYVVDTVGPIPGLRAHPNHLVASTTVVQLSFVESHGLTLGAAAANESKSEPPSRQYSVVSTTALAVTLEWNALPMSASIVKGMPYTTMHYPKPLSSLLPTISSEVKLVAVPLVDGKGALDCRDGKAGRVESELELSFAESDFTWLVFFSQPVMVKCIEHPEGIDESAVMFQVVELAETDEEINTEALTVRTALLNNCTNGENQVFCAHRESANQIQKSAKLLRERAHLYPGPRADVHYDIDNENDEAVLKFDWDVQNTKVQWRDEADPLESGLRRDKTASDEESQASHELIAYALPHHLHRMSADYMPWRNDSFCTQSLIGSICLVSGSSWKLVEDLPSIAFQAPRPPRPDTLSALSDALPTDLSFQLPEYYQRGAGDTYFSGKMLARMARVLLIAEELSTLCNPESHGHLGYSLTSKEKQSYEAACKTIRIPGHDEMNEAISRLRSSVEVWINGTAATPYVYDSGWGGVISCGCQFDSKSSTCSNKFPDCPAVYDQGMNFGNG